MTDGTKTRAAYFALGIAIALLSTVLALPFYDEMIIARERQVIAAERQARAVEARVHQRVLEEEAFWTRAHRERAEKLEADLAAVVAYFGVPAIERILGRDQ